MEYGFHKTWVIGKDDFGSINLRQSACRDSNMFGYCQTKTEILIHFGESYGILKNL